MTTEMTKLSDLSRRKRGYDGRASDSKHFHRRERVMTAIMCDKTRKIADTVARYWKGYGSALDLYSQQGVGWSDWGK